MGKHNTNQRFSAAGSRTAGPHVEEHATHRCAKGRIRAFHVSTLKSIAMFAANGLWLLRCFSPPVDRLGLDPLVARYTPSLMISFRHGFHYHLLTASPDLSLRSSRGDSVHTAILTHERQHVLRALEAHSQRMRVAVVPAQLGRELRFNREPVLRVRQGVRLNDLLPLNRCFPTKFTPRDTSAEVALQNIFLCLVLYRLL